LAGQLVRGVTTGTFTGAGMEAGSQTIELAVGTRDSYDAGAIGIGGLAGGFFGGIGAGPAAVAGIKRLFRSQLSPNDFGLKFLASDKKLLDVWEKVVEGALGSKKENALTRLIKKLDANGLASVTSKELSEAFSAVNSRFLREARKAGYDIAEVHHWNYPKIDNLDNLLDPNRLVPATAAKTHDFMHEATSSAFLPTNSPVSVELGLKRLESVPPPQSAPIHPSQRIR
jgi:hypothetical protein